MHIKVYVICHIILFMSVLESPCARQANVLNQSKRTNWNRNRSNFEMKKAPVWTWEKEKDSPFKIWAVVMAAFNWLGSKSLSCKKVTFLVLLCPCTPFRTKKKSNFLWSLYIRFCKRTPQFSAIHRFNQIICVVIFCIKSNLFIFHRLNRQWTCLMRTMRVYT